VVGYELQEASGWSLDVSRLTRLVEDAKAEGITVRGLVVINPGNPTGTLLSRENMEEVVRWCQRARVVLFADEVYQKNVFGERPFIAFRKVIHDLGPAAKEVECFSFHTVSKGVFGECGRRGGYVQLHNIHPKASEQLYKLFSINLSSNVEGQLMLGLMCNPPKRGEPSHELFCQEEAAIASSLKRRARLATAAFNSMPFVSCQRVEVRAQPFLVVVEEGGVRGGRRRLPVGSWQHPARVEGTLPTAGVRLAGVVQGALYAFPQIALSARAVAKAKEQGVAPDLLYCLELLEETGICAVPGSGFGQKDGTFHLRTTILPPEDVFEEVMAQFRVFHEGFLVRYGSPTPAKL
jgi:aspartate/methionine/tyrosine aminotransferase